MTNASPEPTSHDRLIPLKDAAFRLGTSSTTLRRMFHAGEIPGVWVRGKLKIKVSDVAAYISSHTVVNERPAPRKPVDIRDRWPESVKDVVDKYPHLAS